jgi:hypothetical protein
MTFRDCYLFVAGFFIGGGCLFVDLKEWWPASFALCIGLVHLCEAMKKDSKWKVWGEPE